MDSLRVLIADDHPVFRNGMRALLASLPGMEVVGEATSGAEVIALAAAEQPDVIPRSFSFWSPTSRAMQKRSASWVFDERRIRLALSHNGATA